MIYRGTTDEYLAIAEIKGQNLSGLLEPVRNALMVLWFTENDNSLEIDGSRFCFQKNEIICLTEFHQVNKVEIKGARLIKFNRAFYCIYNHDSEVGCKGLLFFGAQRIPQFKLPNEELDVFTTVFHMFKLEIDRKDLLQLEMLQMMLKRFLILCARVYKAMNKLDQPAADIDLVREYNYLIEQHFMEKHLVSDYAEMLHRSPKTLSNQFRKMNLKSPLQYIKDRRMLEARRRLLRKGTSIQEVAYELGFEDVQSFSRFFKGVESCSPSEFIKQQGTN
ncbi:MAG: helix-turn-helix domain-containing protein [Bacteroidetes bacterium]|nr:helix-turn-helix domain-containing protein [Bacteroidota bacterium]